MLAKKNQFQLCKDTNFLVLNLKIHKFTCRLDDDWQLLQIFWTYLVKRIPQTISKYGLMCKFPSFLLLCQCSNDLKSSYMPLSPEVSKINKQIDYDLVLFNLSGLYWYLL